MDIQYSGEWSRKNAVLSKVWNNDKNRTHVPFPYWQAGGVFKQKGQFGPWSCKYVLLCLRKVSLWYKIMNQWTYSWKCKEGDGKYRKAWSHNFPWPSSRNSVSITNRCHSDLKLQVAFVIRVHLCARKVLHLLTTILVLKLLLTTPHHRASA